MFGAQEMGGPAGFLAGNPFRIARVRCQLAIQCKRGLQGDEGHTDQTMFDIALVEIQRLALEQASLHLKTFFLEVFDTSAGYPIVRIETGHDDAFYACWSKRHTAGSGAPVMRAGFQSDIKGCPLGFFAGLGKG